MQQKRKRQDSYPTIAKRAKQSPEEEIISLHKRKVVRGKYVKAASYDTRKTVWGVRKFIKKHLELHQLRQVKFDYPTREDLDLMDGVAAGLVATRKDVEFLIDAGVTEAWPLLYTRMILVCFGAAFDLAEFLIKRSHALDADELLDGARQWREVFLVLKNVSLDRCDFRMLKRLVDEGRWKEAVRFLPYMRKSRFVDVVLDCPDRHLLLQVNNYAILKKVLDAGMTLADFVLSDSRQSLVDVSDATWRKVAANQELVRLVLTYGISDLAFGRIYQEADEPTRTLMLHDLEHKINLHPGRMEVLFCDLKLLRKFLFMCDLDVLVGSTIVDEAMRDIKILRLVVDRGLPPSAITPRLLRLALGNLVTLEFLLDWQHQGVTVQGWRDVFPDAINAGIKVLQMFKGNGMNIPKISPEELFRCSLDADKLRFLLDWGLDPELLCAKDYELIRTSIERGHLDLVRVFYKLFGAGLTAAEFHKQVFTIKQFY